MIYLICLSSSDWIAIVNILVTAGIGFWIAKVVQTNLTTTRAVKDYFIKECQDIRESYRRFNNDLFSGRCSAKYIINWFKIMSFRIDDFESLLSFEFVINTDLSARHSKIKQFITGTEEMNNQFKNATISLDPSTMSEIIQYNQELSRMFLTTVIAVNRSHKKFHWHKKVVKSTKA